MAIEDAAVLAKLMADVSSTEELPLILQTFQKMRMPRKLKVQNLSMHNLYLYHLEDGEEQIERDSSRPSRPEEAPIWSNQGAQVWLYGFESELL